MGFFARFQVVTATTISIGIFAVIFELVGGAIGQRIQSSDPFSDLLGQVQTFGPLVLSMLLLAILVWFIVSSIQEERTVETRRR
jgi:ABC-type multidrug transport system permease subunit